jgi:hypothetical protein
VTTPGAESGVRRSGFVTTSSPAFDVAPLLIAQDLQFRYVNDQVESLPDEPDIRLTSLDSFTRVDGILSPRHAITGMVALSPREIEHRSMNTFRPIAATISSLPSLPGCRCAGLRSPCNPRERRGSRAPARSPDVRGCAT